MTVWEVKRSDNDLNTRVTVWTEISTTKPKTLTGISSVRVVVRCIGTIPYMASGGDCGAELWIDDVFIGVK
jgi:hypothetical protein